MAETKKTIRRIQPAVHTAVDDARWPTNVALLLLAGVTGTLVLLAGGFDDPRLLHNGWLRLVTLAATLVALGVAANTLCPRRARRLQTAVLLSLILHILLAVFLYQQHLRQAALEEPPPSPIEAPELLNPQYVEVTDPTTPRPFEEPVTASVDSNIAETLDVSRSDVTRREPIEAVATVDPQESLPRATSRERQLARAAPQQSETLSRLSRQTREETVQSAPVELARATPSRPVDETSPLATPAAELARSRAEPLPAEAMAEPVERTLAESAAEPARPQAAREEPRIAQAQALPRQTAPADATTAEATEVPEVRELAQTQSETALGPESEPLPRQTAQQSVDSPEVRPEMSIAIRESRPRRELTELPAEPELSLARTPEPSRQRDRAEISAEASPLAASRRPSDRTTEAGEGELQSQPTTLARASRPDPAAEPQVDPSELAGGTPIAGTPHAASRAHDQQDPSITAQIASQEPRRTLRPADAVASPAEADAALAANASVPEEPTIEPSQVAIARADAGVLGGEAGRNLANDLPSTPQQSAPQPSAAARRPTATQQSTGPALSPSASVQIARAISEADAPVLGAAAVPIETAESAGSAEPSRVVASAGATVQRSEAAAPLSPVVAAEGTSSADLGAEQRVPDAGERRAGGGGAPEITLAAALPVRRRIGEGGGPSAAIDASDIAELPSAPATSGQTAATRAPTIDAAETPGGRAAPATIVNAEPLTGGATVASTAGELAPSNLHRRRSANSVEGLQPGGGIRSPRRRFVDGSAVAPDVSVAVNVGSPVAEPSPIRPQPGPSPSVSAGIARTRTDGRRQAARSSETASPGSGPTDRTVHVAASAERGSRRTSATVRPEQQFATAAAPRALQTAELPRVETSLSDLPLAASPAAGGTADGPTSRRDADSPLGRAERAVTVSIDEPLHEGGLAVAPAEAAGSPDRRAQPHSSLVRIEPDRFLKRRAGGVAALGGDVRATAPAFARRTERNNEPTPRSAGQPSAKTEAAIELGLVYLARHQHPDGRWSLEYTGVDYAVAPHERPILQADTAATGLALLAFLGAGYDHYDDKYRDVIDRGLRFLISNQKEDGDLYLPEDDLSNQFNHFYSHGIAAIALCEAYGMTGDAILRQPAQRALDFIVASQHPDHGGWRYVPGGVAFSSDLSVTGWQVMALKSGELAGLDVPQKTYAEVRRFLAECVAPNSGGARYVYNPWVGGAPNEEQRRGARPSTVMTAVGVLLDLYLGSNRDQAALARGADHLLANLPTQDPDQPAPAIHTIGNPHRDTYYWYYATLVMFHMKGDYWEKWNEMLHPLLVSSQTQHGALAGSWNPHKPVRDQWASQAGRLYVTTMNLLSLEVYYRHLPLYEATGR